MALGIAYEARNVDLNIINSNLSDVLQSGNVNLSALIGHGDGIVIGPDAKDPALRGHIEDVGAYGEKNPQQPMFTLDGRLLKAGKLYHAHSPARIINPIKGVQIIADGRLITDDCMDCGLHVVGNVPDTTEPSLVVGVATTSTLSTTKGDISVKANHGSNFHPNSSLIGAIKSHLPSFDLSRLQNTLSQDDNDRQESTVNVSVDATVETGFNTDADEVDMSADGMRIISRDGSSVTMDSSGIHTTSCHGSVSHTSNRTTIITEGRGGTQARTVIINAP